MEKHLKEIAVEMKGITKKFGDFVANDSIDLTVEKGEVHAILGENGAGKSTLMNVLYGLLRPTEGKIFVGGKQVAIANPNDAIANGIGMVHQHFMLIQPFTVVENIILGMEPTKGGIVLDHKTARAKVVELSKTYGLDIDPDAAIASISVGMQQRVEILKALYRGAQILILDEPTAVLTPQEILELAQIVKNLTAEGKSVIIITHKLKEIKMMADRCTIIRRGKMIDTVEVTDCSELDLASMMVGREVSFKVDKGPANVGDMALEIKELRVKNNKGLEAVRSFDLALHKGEILGIAGIDGNGQSELIEAITGLRKVVGGMVAVNGKDLTNASPRKVIDSYVGHIPEDRQHRGLVLDFTMAENMVLERVSCPPFSKSGLLRQNAIVDYCKRLIEQFDVRPPKPGAKARALSGGNQQKVIIAREIAGDPDVLIAAQPTRGLDVGAIEYVHKALIAQRDAGKAVLLVSLDLDEVMNVADRIAVIYEGRIVGIVPAEGADEHQLGLMMAGGGKSNG